MRMPVEPPLPPLAQGVANGPWEEIGTPLVVDEPQARVWIERIPAGVTRPLHTHHAPWLTVVINGGQADVLAPDGRKAGSVQLTTGQVKVNPLPEGPVRHAMRNTGENELVLVAIQLPEREETVSHTPEGRP